MTTTMLALPTSIENILAVRMTWVATKEAELANARQALELLRQSGATERKLRRVSERINLLRKVVKVLQAGYIPIPRFQSSVLRLDQEELPLSAVVAVEEAQMQKVFDELRIAQGQEPASRQGNYGRVARTDPIVIGVVRTPEVSHHPPGDDWRRVIDVPGQEEHFLIAWWWPEDIALGDGY